MTKSCSSCCNYIKLPEKRLGLCLLSYRIEREPYITSPGLAICDVTLPKVFCDDWEGDE